MKCTFCLKTPFDNMKFQVTASHKALNYLMCVGMHACACVHVYVGTVDKVFFLYFPMKSFFQSLFSSSRVPPLFLQNHTYMIMIIKQNIYQH